MNIYEKDIDFKDIEYVELIPYGKLNIPSSGIITTYRDEMLEVLRSESIVDFDGVRVFGKVYGHTKNAMWIAHRINLNSQS